MKHALLIILAALAITLWGCSASSQEGTSGRTSAAAAKKDSLKLAKRHQDSLRIAGLLAVAQYPLIKGGKYSGVIPVDNPTEIPNPDQDYKLLFELTERNPDSLAKEINSGLDEVARVLNLHVASGIPQKRITPVVVIHGPGIEAVMNNESYRKKHSLDNPNLNIVRDLENAGTKFIVCGQAMAFFGFTKDQLLPEIKISLTAQTVLSNYQLQGYVLYSVKSDR